MGYKMENKEITLEQIDLLMERAKVSYTDAKEALEATNGDLLEALLWLEKNNRMHTSSNGTADFSSKVTGIIDKLNHTRFKMFKKNVTYVNVPLSLALLLTVCTLHVSIILFLICLVIGVKIELEGDCEMVAKVNETINKVQQ